MCNMREVESSLHFVGARLTYILSQIREKLYNTKESTKTEIINILNGDKYLKENGLTTNCM